MGQTTKNWKEFLGRESEDLKAVEMNLKTIRGESQGRGQKTGPANYDGPRGMTIYQPAQSRG
jgi:hypothetical protein